MLAGVSQERMDELARCFVFAHFLRERVWIKHTTAAAGVFADAMETAPSSTLKWEWWPVHDQMLRDLTNRQLIVLKARQISWSWFLAAYALHGCIFRPNYEVLIISKGQREAKEFLEKVKFIWEHLPTWLQVPLETDNTDELGFTVQKSKILAFPATEDAGRSFTGSLVCVDEAAYHPYAAENYVSYGPAIDAGGQLVVVSTANGMGNWFHNMYHAAKNGAIQFACRFYSWRVRPGRNDAWLVERKAALEAAGKGDKLQQEYASDDATAFLVSGRPRFDVESLRTAIEGCKPPLEVHRLPERLRHMTGLSVWQLPQPGQAYVAATDSAQGLGDGDFDCTVILKARTLEHVATLHGKWEPDYFGELSVQLCRAYNEAFWGVENAPQGHGHTVLATARRLQYPRLYWHRRQANRRQERDGLEPTTTLGWLTNEGTKPELIDDLASAIVTGALVSWDTRFWGECLSYVVDGRGRTNATAGCFDDRVIAVAIARRMAMQPEALFVPRAAPSGLWAPGGYTGGHGQRESVGYGYHEPRG